MRNLKSSFILGIVGVTLGLSLEANAVPVDLELSLLIDVSPRVDNTEYALQLAGYQAAFEDAAVQAAIAGLPNGIATNVIFFSQNDYVGLNFCRGIKCIWRQFILKCR